MPRNVLGWNMVKDPNIKHVMVDTLKREIRYNPALGMVRFESGTRFLVFEWDLKRPEGA